MQSIGICFTEGYHTDNSVEALRKRYALLLERRSSIPQVAAKLPLIKEISTDAFWEAHDILALENVRKELRDLIKFIVDGDKKDPIITKLVDPVIDSKEGEKLDAAYDFEDYREKVNRYINEHGNILAIYKLTHNSMLKGLVKNTMDIFLVRLLKYVCTACGVRPSNFSAPNLGLILTLTTLL